MRHSPWRAGRSSPRLRGTHLTTGTYNSKRPIIPALAGNTQAWTQPEVDALDHPRACGEHPRAERRPCCEMGSSPRLRGTHLGLLIGALLAVIIPALAGNTLDAMLLTFEAHDHPRACGEHTTMFDGHRISTGIIPALAGNTLGQGGLVDQCPDHPRACGEHTCPRPAGFGFAGSSPRLRGTHEAIMQDMGAWQIIPALAGNTQRSVASLI